MATAISSPTTATAPSTADVIRRHIKRTLPCELTETEELAIAKEAAKKRRRLRELESDLAAEKKRRQQQIDELQAEIDTSDKELDTGEQDRVVLCDEIFRGGTVYIRRSDTLDEIEPRPATAQEAQRYLPAVESAFAAGPAAPLLDQAAAAQEADRVRAREPANDADDGVPDGIDGDEPEDDGLSDPPREAKEARVARRGGGEGKAKAKRGGKGSAK